jgi:hypothetical protein
LKLTKSRLQIVSSTQNAYCLTKGTDNELQVHFSCINYITTLSVQIDSLSPVIVSTPLY